METKTFSIREALDTGWNNLEGHFKTFAGAMAIILVVSLISFLLNLGTSLIGTIDTNLAMEVNILISVLSFIILFGLNIISMILYYGVKKIALKAHRNKQEIKVSDIFLDYQIVLKLLLFHFIILIVGLLGLLIIGAFVVLLATILGMAYENVVVVGALIIVVLLLVIYIVMRLFFTTYFIIDNNIKLFKAVECSWKITDGVVGKLFLLNVILMLINVAGMIFGIVLGNVFITQPFGISTMVGVYNELDSPEQKNVSDSLVIKNNDFTQE
ncbi:hypothetical protein [Halanaerobacter jeridensis]|uniref:Glycerophosphoryl diester phosphodiesterase membrane domain-containing protein n=1 Tax=Halanaerobacter jeridensis TaxID=706427 RepID=A0A938XNI9_9FIRM|nr:hypothetical protein [Halanaerobacter jeridensis]MBM7555492.1 hypothetical protein [Halanaerobacter jeridensis]